MKIYTNKQWEALVENQKYVVRRALISVGQSSADEIADILVGFDKPRPDITYKIEKIAEEWIGCLYHSELDQDKK